MRRKTAKEILTESFRELAETRKITKITVKDITDNCGYSPATFYRYFKDKYDLISQEYTENLDRIMSEVNAESCGSWKQTLVNGAYYYQENKNYLANLFTHTDGMDAFIRKMRDYNNQALIDAVRTITGEEPDEITKGYIRIYVLGTVQLTCEWILDEFHVTVDELVTIYENSLPEPLKNILL